MSKYSPLLIVVILMLVFGCKKSSTEPESGIKSMTLSHWGVDFSEGKVGSQSANLDYTKSDGETVGWCAYGNSSSNPTGVWYRPYVDKLKKLSVADISSVGTVDTTNWATDVCSTPLQKGEVWLAKCKDGFAAFLVKSTPDPNASFWTVDVEYVFSKTNKFN